jgi:serine/threonine-protein kinase
MMDDQPTRMIPELGVDSPITTESQGHDPWIGRTLGDFMVEESIGHGGMGTVYRARQVSLGRSVALKFLNSGRTLSHEAILRFEAEARIAARMNHPNVVHIYALGTMESQPYIAMEYVSGRNLGQILNERIKNSEGPIALPECLSMMKQACQGLQAATEIGLVHRDIKPENLMVTEKGLVKVADFGLARTTQTESARMTQTGYTLGTPMYMSPEQVQGKLVDARSDIYSLGMTFHHLLSGRPPLMADSPYAMAMKQIHDRPVSVRLLRPDCPTGLSDLIDWMIEKSVESRPQDPREVLELIQRYELGLNVHVPGRIGNRLVEAPPSRFSSRNFEIEKEGLKPVTTKSRRGWLIWGIVTLGASIRALFIGRYQAKRSEDLTDTKSPVWPVGSELADWKRVPRQLGADSQYRYAQIRAVEEDQLAAWLAVPCYFPDEEDWAWRAYVQLTGDLVRHSDRFRLTWMRDALDKAGRGVEFEVLSQVVGAALAGMDRNEISFLENLHPLVKETMDPNLAELILTILIKYRQKIPRDQAIPVRLDKLQSQILEILQIDPKTLHGNFPTNPASKP